MRTRADLRVKPRAPLIYKTERTFDRKTSKSDVSSFCHPVKLAAGLKRAVPATQVAARVPAGRREPRPARRRPLPQARLRRATTTCAQKARMSDRKTLNAWASAYWIPLRRGRRPPASPLAERGPWGLPPGAIRLPISRHAQPSKAAPHALAILDIFARMKESSRADRRSE